VILGDSCEIEFLFWLVFFASEVNACDSDSDTDGDDANALRDCVEPEAALIRHDRLSRLMSKFAPFIKELVRPSLWA
jgi:hypothetical protein